MILLQYLAIALALWLLAYSITTWHDYIDDKRLEPILKDFEYRQFLTNLKRLYNYDLAIRDTSYYELQDLVKILPRESPFDKEAYLRSPQWQDIRRIILRRDQYACCKCGNDGVPLEIHHITYARLGHEHYSDLASLCRTCHQSVHDKHGYSYTSTFPIGD